MSEGDVRKILIIEDEEPLLESYSEILEASDFKCFTADDGYKGLDILEAESGKLDIVLLDLMMPGIDGLEVLRTIVDDRDKYGQMPIIVLTNMTSDKVIKEAFEIGAKSYLIKTELDYEDLVKEVERVLSGE